MKATPGVCGSRVPHGATEPILNGGGVEIGRLCLRCHRPAASLETCFSCKKRSMCTTLKRSRGTAVWFCDDGCADNHAAVVKKAKDDAAAARKEPVAR